MSKRRGGQPGNVNAVKHGFYSRRFRELEAEDLDAALQNGLGDEIDMMRVYKLLDRCKALRICGEREFLFSSGG